MDMKFFKMSVCLIRAIQCLCLLYKIVSQAVGANIAMNFTASDEQTGLQEALFLVKLLRSEYARVLQEKNELLKSNVINKQELVTSATTERKYDKTKINGRYIKHGGRRFQYDDMFGSQPDNINTSKSIAEVTSTFTTSSPISENITQNITTISTTLVHFQHSFNHSESIETYTTSLLKLPESPPSPSTKITSSSLNNTTQDFKKLKHQIITQKSSPQCQMQQQPAPPPVPYPEMSQVAVELERELSFGFQNKNYATYTLPATRRTTIRVHLAGSTRYPIPLPENHAFCFTNPKSALCRTLI